MTEEIAKKRHARVMADQDALIRAAERFFSNKSQANNQAVIQAVKAMHMATLTFQQEVQELLEFYVEDVQIFSGQIMGLSSGADQVAKILLNTRILEKDYIRSENEDTFSRIIQNISEIDVLVSDIKAEIDDAEKTRPLDGIQEVVNNYIRSFKAYAELMKEQTAVKTAMENAAAAIESTSLSAKDRVASQMNAARPLPS